MKQRKLIATILTIILTAATVLTVFAAFRFEVQFPSKLNTFTYDGTSASFKFNGESQSFTLNLSDPGSGDEYEAVVTGDTNTPLTYAYTLSLGEMDSEQNKTLLSSIFVYLNGEIQGTLYSIITHETKPGMIGKGSYVLPNDTENDTISFELHLASDATPYKDASLSITVNCTATNHNAQKYTFVSSDTELAQAISEVNRGAANKTIVMYGGFSLSQGYTISNPCTLDLNNVNFNGQTVTVNITDGVTEGEPTDIVTVTGAGATGGNFSITAGAIDRKDSASNVNVTVGTDANEYSIQYIIDSHLESLITHGMQAGDELDFSTKGFGCYIDEITVSGSSYLQYDDENMTLSVVDNQDDPLLVSEVATATIKMITGAEHTHTVKVIGASDAVFANLFAEGGELYYLEQLTVAGTDVSYSVPLPTTIKSINATIEWHSSDPEKFSNQGVCSPSANGYVTLTAVIRINEQVYTHDVKIHIATLTNKDRLEAMIAAMGNITLSKLYPSTATDNVNGLIDGNYGDLPMAGTTTGGYEQYIKLAIPTQDDQGNAIEKQQITTFDISGLTYSIDKATYGYIDVVDIDANADDDVSQNVVVLKQSTFNTLAEVQVTATFETGDSDEETSIIYVNIELGENKDLGDQVLAYVRNKLSEVNVLQNMLDTRISGEEKGDFELPTEYSGFDIVYQINSNADQNIISTIDITTDAAGNAITDTELLKKNEKIVENGQFEINAEGFKNVAHDVTVTVSVLIKGTHTISTGNVIASADMTFTVPAAIHCDTDATVKYGFCDSTLFQSVRKQVMEQATPAYSKNGDAFVDADKNYILVRDIENCTTLSIDGEGVSNVCLNGLAYFTNLTTFGASNFDSSFATQLSRAAATYKKLTSLTLSNVGLTDLSPVLELDLSYLDVSGNADLKDISDIAKYDATKLGYLNISGTAVNMERTRSLLTAMYYKYEGKNGTTPKYLYTHEYTPIADGALLLEPDAISVTTENGTTTATIGGDELLINGATYSGNTITIGSSDTAISIDGKKSVSVKAGTPITVIKKGEVHVSGNSVMVNDAIVSFVLTSGMTSSSFQIADLWLSGTVTISNATVSNNIITVGDGGGSLDSTIDDEDMTLTAGTIPVLSGIISKDDDAKTVTITPLKYTVDNNDGDLEDIGDYRNNGLTDNGTDTVIGHANMTRIDITGATLNGTNIIVGANGGTIKVSVSGQETFEFAVRSNTTIQADTIGNMIMVENGIISILPVNNTDPALPTTAGKVTFSDAEIYNKPSTVQVTNNGTTTTKAISIPTIKINAGCVMTIDDKFSVVIENATEIPLPSYAVGTNANGTVTLEAYNVANPVATFTEKKFELINYETTQSANDPYEPGGVLFVDDNNYDHNGWYMHRVVYGIGDWIISQRYSATQTVQAISDNAPKYLRINGNKWIPIATNSISFTGSQVESEAAMANWGTILNHTTDSGVLSFDLGSSGNYNNNNSINISGAFTGNTSAFAVGITTNNFTSATPQATLPTESINPIYAGIRTTLPDAKQSIAPNVVDYFGEKIQYFGCSLSGTTVTPTDGYQWYAILLDGEYITISDGATVEVITEQNGKYKVTVTNGTSTIGKGALITTENINVTHSTSSATEQATGIFSISGGAPEEVKVKYSKPDGSTTILAHIDNLIFEPIVTNDEEKAGINILFLLSEVPGVSHYDYGTHGTYVQLAPTVHYGNGGLSVNVTWSVAPESMAYVAYADYYGSPRLETLQPTSGLTFVDGVAEKEVTVIAQVNVQGVVSTRYFTFTVTYYSN